MVVESVGGTKTNSGAENRVSGPRGVNNAELKGFNVGSPVIEHTQVNNVPKMSQ